jgi:chemotaxis protein histidine kinase CheA
MDEDELKQKILGKLEAMEEVSLKVLRAELEEELGINLLAQKDFIKEVVNESINGEEEKPKEAKKAPVRPPPKVTPKPSQTPKSSQTRKRSQSSDNEDEDEAPQQKKKKLQQTPEGDEYIEVCFINTY